VNVSDDEATVWYRAADVAGNANTPQSIQVPAAVKTLTATPTPTISGTARVGSPLTANPGTWTPIPVTLTYQWFRSGTPIKGATSRTYWLTSADLGAAITVTVTGSKTGYTSVSKASTATRVAPGLLSAARPTIAGATKVGKRLTAVTGSWRPSPVRLAYQWFRGGKAIKGATGAQYKLRAADRHKTITVRVTGSKKGYTTVAMVSKASKRVR
jgi:hypothetical protein